MQTATEPAASDPPARRSSDFPAWREGWDAHRTGRPLLAGRTPLFREGWLARDRHFPRT